MGEGEEKEEKEVEGLREGGRSCFLWEEGEER